MVKGVKIASKLAALLLVGLNCSLAGAHATGVTLITHGLNGNADGWVQAMANAIAEYTPRTTNAALYRMEFFLFEGNWYIQMRKLGGGNPLEVTGGNIVVTLNWRQLADGNSYNTYQIAAAVAPVLFANGFVSDLRGHALAEYPLHLIGHSRGGSLICELSRLLGERGVWVDHVTTLDAHPLNDPSFLWDFLLYEAVDAPAVIYENVLFGDSYYQTSHAFVYGKPADGSFWRLQSNLTGGYVDLITGSHSDIHLWYHGTIERDTPATDWEAWITAWERNNWWTETEDRGSRAGFFYSRIGGGNRMSLLRPNGANSSAVVAGFNQRWDLGTAGSNNRTPLAVNSGEWPSPILLNLLSTNVVDYGDTSTFSVSYQWAQPASQALKLDVYADRDLNPFNGNERLLRTGIVPGTTADQIITGTTDVVWRPTNAAPGMHAVFLKLSVGERSRFLYAPEFVSVRPPTPPKLEISAQPPGAVLVAVTGTAGQTLVLEVSPDLSVWEPLATNSLTSSRWEVTLPVTGMSQQAFLRVVAE